MARHTGAMTTDTTRPRQRVVHLLGPLAITAGSETVTTTIPAGRASALLVRLGAAGGSSVSADALIDALWPDEPPASAGRTVASLVSRLRSSLGLSSIDGTTSSGYRFGVGQAWTTDVILAERLIAEAQDRSDSAPALAAASARSGLDLLDRGPPFDNAYGRDATWADELIRHVHGLRRRLQRCLWEADARLGRWAELIDSTEAALAAEPHDEAAGRALMLAHWNSGDRGAALVTHDQIRARLRDELGVEPGPETDSLYSAIVRNENVAARVKRVRPIATVGDVHLAGRDEELAQLVDLWNEAAGNRLVSVVVTGSIGSGQTNLGLTLDDIAERTGGRVLRAQSTKGERSLFLHPILTMVTSAILSTPADEIPDLVGPFLGTVAELIPELRRVCSVEPYQRASADLEHRRAFQAIGHIVSGLSRKHPVLLIFDDLHHAGASTVEALQWLQHELRDRPILILSTVQADHHDRHLDDFVASSKVIELRPVTHAAVTEISADAGFPEAADFVWELTHGHLFFVHSVLDALGRGVAIEQIAGSVGSVVLDAARRAGADVHSALQIAAVIGNAFDLDTLEHVSALPRAQLIATLESAVTASLVEARDDGFVFSNPLIQQVMYESMVRPIRRERHRRVADVSDDNAERRAWHLAEAGALAESAAAWLDAARLAQRAFSNADADRLLTEAIACAEQCGDDACLGEALIARGIVRTELGEYASATEDHLRSERLAISIGDREMRARSVERLGWVAYYERDVGAATARAEEATAIPGAHPSARVLLGRTLHWAGDFAGATDAYNRALEELDDEDAAVKASALSCLGALLAHNDRYDEAIEILDESVALCRQIGAFRPLLRSLFFEGLARANLGDLSGALTTFETKSTLLERYDVPFYRARTNTCLAWIWRELGDHGRSHELSERALDESREVDEGELQVEQELHALCSLAECAIVTGHHDDAAARLVDAQALLDQWLPFRGRAELRVVELRSRIGAASAEQLLEDARAAGSPKYQALAFHLLGRTEEAGAAAATTGSMLLMAEVASPELAASASARLVARLPRQLRPGFEVDGRLARLTAR